MNRLFSLIAVAAVVAIISFPASWATSQPVWRMVVLVGSGVLVAGFVQSLGKGAPRANGEGDGSSVPVLAIRFAIGALVLACMTTSMLWFMGLATP